MTDLLPFDVLTEYLDSLGIGSGQISTERIGEGQSNITYLVRRGAAEFVLRRGPRPPLPKSTHDMLREARIQRALHGTGIAVPEILAVCEDESLLGVPFYLMRFVPGHIITDSLPPEFAAPASQRRLAELTVESLAALHSIDVSIEPFASLGRAEGYLARQVKRFASLWPADSARHLPQVQQLADWLLDNLPISPRAAIVHGDYRMGNLMFTSEHASATPQLAAVLDWEMATLGDPLADLGYLAATWSNPDEERTTMHLSPITAHPGFLNRDELVAHYVALAGVDASALPWYEALALWKASIFSEEIYTRWLKGEKQAATSLGPALEKGVPQLLETAAAFAAQL